MKPEEIEKAMGQELAELTSNPNIDDFITKGGNSNVKSPTSTSSVSVPPPPAIPTSVNNSNSQISPDHLQSTSTEDSGVANISNGTISPPNEKHKELLPSMPSFNPLNNMGATAASNLGYNQWQNYNQLYDMSGYNNLPTQGQDFSYNQYYSGDMSNVDTQGMYFDQNQVGSWNTGM